MRADYLPSREGEKTWHDHVDADDDDVVDCFSLALYWLWHSLFIIIIIIIMRVVRVVVVTYCCWWSWRNETVPARVRMVKIFRFWSRTSEWFSCDPRLVFLWYNNIRNWSCHRVLDGRSLKWVRCGYLMGVYVKYRRILIDMFHISR